MSERKTSPLGDAEDYVLDLKGIDRCVPALPNALVKSLERCGLVEGKMRSTFLVGNPLNNLTRRVRTAFLLALKGCYSNPSVKGTRR